MGKDLVKLCIDTHRGNVRDFSAKDSSEVIRKAFIDMLGTDKPSYKEFRRCPEAFEIMEEVLDEIMADSFADNPFFDQFVEQRNLALGDTNVFYVEDKSILSVAEIAEGTWNTRRQRLDVGQSFPVKTRVYNVHIYEEFLRFVAGRVDFGRMIQKVGEAMNLKMAEEIYANFLGAMAYLPTELKESGSFVEDTMLDIVSHVEIASGYGDIVIAGTKKALKELDASYTGVNSFLVSDRMKDEKNQTGLISMWNGYRLLEIPQTHIRNTFDFKLDDKALFILPANTKPIKMVSEGESLIREKMTAQDNEDMSIEYNFITRYGFSVLFDKALGFYKIV